VIFRIADLPGLMLGQTVGNSVWIDSFAAGYGWFIDLTPNDESEFEEGEGERELEAAPAGEAYGHMDLLTVVTHELGHVLGFDDVNPDTGGLMSATLDEGERLLTEDGMGSRIGENSNGLVAMETSDTEEPLAGTLQPDQKSWLLDFLTDTGFNGDDPLHPNKKIKILID